MPPPAANDTGTSLGQDGSDWSRDLVILNFDLGGNGAGGWCESSSSIRVPSLKFVCLAVRKILCTMCVTIDWNGELDLWPFDLKTGVRVASKVGNLRSEFGHARPSGSLVSRYVRDGRTDRRTDGRTDRRADKSKPYCPLSTGGGIIRCSQRQQLICDACLYVHPK